MLARRDRQESAVRDWREEPEETRHREQQRLVGARPNNSFAHSRCRDYKLKATTLCLFAKGGFRLPNELRVSAVAVLLQTQYLWQEQRDAAQGRVLRLLKLRRIHLLRPAWRQRPAGFFPLDRFSPLALLASTKV